MTDCGCRFQYVNGENERIWLATANSELRSALLKAEQEIERLRDKVQDLRMHAEQDAAEIERLFIKGNELRVELIGVYTKLLGQLERNELDVGIGTKAKRDEDTHE